MHSKYNAIIDVEVCSQDYLLYKNKNSLRPSEGLPWASEVSRNDEVVCAGGVTAFFFVSSSFSASSGHLLPASLSLLETIV